MKNKLIYIKHNIEDYILSITAMGQSFLSILQQLLIDVLQMSEESANTIRVLATAIPILIAMTFVGRRQFKSIIAVYIPVLIILFFTVIIWPARWSIMSNDVLKFLLPVVIPTGLCILSIKNLKVFFDCAFFVSVASFIIAVLYVYGFFTGAIIFDGYSMGFSYSILLPCVILMTQNKYVWKISSVFLLISMLAIGSRGALLTSLIYFLILYVWHRPIKKVLVYGCVLGILVILLYNPIIDLFTDLFSSIGIESRTLSLLTDGELINHDSGRDELKLGAKKLIDDAPLFGNGVWADREYLNIYCHNIYLELLIDFGYIGGWILILLFSTYILSSFKCLNKQHRLVLIMFLVSTITPLMASSSYLISYNLSMALGVAGLLKRCAKNKVYQSVNFSE